MFTDTRPLTILDAAYRLGTHPDTVRRWLVEEHRAPFMRVGSKGAIKIQPADLERLVKRER